MLIWTFLCFVFFCSNMPELLLERSGPYAHTSFAVHRPGRGMFTVCPLCVQSTPVSSYHHNCIPQQKNKKREKGKRGRRSDSPPAPSLLHLSDSLQAFWSSISQSYSTLERFNRKWHQRRKHLLSLQIKKKKRRVVSCALVSSVLKTKVALVKNFFLYTHYELPSATLSVFCFHRSTEFIKYWLPGSSKINCPQTVEENIAPPSLSTLIQI